jgi:rhodanese-related sulfurtransferase
MEQIIEFVGNHLLLSAAFVVVLVMLIKAEFEHQTLKSCQLDPTAAIRMMNSNDAMVLDVREAADFSSGHLKNAKNIPISSLHDKLGELSGYQSKPILAYCRSGNASGKACRLLKKSGFTDVYNISGGIAGWQEANLPLTKK